MTKDKRTRPNWNIDISRVVGDSAAELCPLCHRQFTSSFWRRRDACSLSLHSSCGQVKFHTSNNKAGDPHHHCVRGLLSFRHAPAPIVPSCPGSYRSVMPRLLCFRHAQAPIFPSCTGSYRSVMPRLLSFRHAQARIVPSCPGSNLSVMHRLLCFRHAQAPVSVMHRLLFM